LLLIYSNIYLGKILNKAAQTRLILVYSELFFCLSVCRLESKIITFGKLVFLLRSSHVGCSGRGGRGGAGLGDHSNPIEAKIHAIPTLGMDREELKVGKLRICWGIRVKKTKQKVSFVNLYTIFL
jgi:hypothetical protein